MVWCLDLVASVAAGDVFPHHSAYCRPIEVSRYQFSRFKSSKVVGFRVVMEMTYHLAAECVIHRYVYPPCVGKSFGSDFPFFAPVLACLGRSSGQTIGVPTILQFMSVAIESEVSAALIVSRRSWYCSTVAAKVANRRAISLSYPIL